MHSLMILATNKFQGLECHLIYDILWKEKWALNKKLMLAEKGHNA